MCMEKFVVYIFRAMLLVQRDHESAYILYNKRGKF